MSMCYWCGEEVNTGEGAREHLVPRTLLQDADSNISDLVVPAENAHKKCNQMLARSFEHDFCQIIFNYSLFDQNAKKHVASKIRNLQQRPTYLKNQFDKMHRTDTNTQIKLTGQEKRSFEECIKKIIKGIYFKKFNTYLDLDDEYIPRIIWSTLNLEHDPEVREISKMLIGLLGNQIFEGNKVFKYRFAKTEDGRSMVWDFLFYDRFPISILLVHKDEKESFKFLEV